MGWDGMGWWGVRGGRWEVDGVNVVLLALVSVSVSFSTISVVNTGIDISGSISINALGCPCHVMSILRCNGLHLTLVFHNTMSDVQRSSLSRTDSKDVIRLQN